MKIALILSIASIQYIAYANADVNCPAVVTCANANINQCSVVSPVVNTPHTWVVVNFSGSVNNSNNFYSTQILPSDPDNPTSGIPLISCYYNGGYNNMRLTNCDGHTQYCNELMASPSSWGPTAIKVQNVQNMNSNFVGSWQQSLPQGPYIKFCPQNVPGWVNLTINTVTDSNINIITQAGFDVPTAFCSFQITSNQISTYVVSITDNTVVNLAPATSPNPSNLYSKLKYNSSTGKIDVYNSDGSSVVTSLTKYTPSPVSPIHPG